MVQRQKEGFHVRDLENAGPEHQPPPALQLGKFHTSPFLFIVVSFFFFRPAPGHLGRGNVSWGFMRSVVCPRSRLRYRLLPLLAAWQEASVPFRPLFGTWSVWLWSRVSVNEITKPGTWSLPPVDLTEPANVPGLQRVLLATAVSPQLLGDYLGAPS